jgi:hypothetical protein
MYDSSRMTIGEALPRVLSSVVLIAALNSIGCGQSSSNNETPAPATGQPPASAQRAQAPAPDVTAADTNLDVGQVRINLSIAQRPIVPEAKTRFCVRTEIDGIPADLTKGQLSLTMDTPVADQRHPLSESEGCYVADVVLPVSANGNTRWYATVEGVVDEQPVSARFQFDVAKPTTAQ